MNPITVASPRSKEMEEEKSDLFLNPPPSDTEEDTVKSVYENKGERQFVPNSYVGSPGANGFY